MEDKEEVSQIGSSAVNILEYIEKIKCEQRLTDKDIAGWLGISRVAFCQRKLHGSFNFWQLQRIMEKSRASNDDILSLFGRKQDPDMMQRQVMNELHEIKMIVKRSVES